MENEKNFAVLLGVSYMRVEKVDVTGAKTLLGKLYELIDNGCDIVEPVRVKGLPEGYVMIVDEEGRLKANQELNVIGSYLYGMHKHGEPIVGNAVIVKEVYTNDGVEWAWLTEEEADNIERKMSGRIWRDAIMKISKYLEDLLEPENDIVRTCE